jgi:hypothetical protein
LHCPFAASHAAIAGHVVTTALPDASQIVRSAPLHCAFPAGVHVPPLLLDDELLLDAALLLLEVLLLALPPAPPVPGCPGVMSKMALQPPSASPAAAMSSEKEGSW